MKYGDMVEVTFCVPQETPAGIGMMTRKATFELSIERFAPCMFGNGFWSDGEWFPCSSIVKVKPINE